MSLAPQAFSPDHFGTRGSSTPAASNRYVRGRASPHLRFGRTNRSPRRHGVALLKAEIETGMFKKPVEVLAKEIHCEPLPPEVRAVVIAASSRGGLLPAPVVEKMVPAKP